MGDLSKFFSAAEFRCRCGRAACDAKPPSARLIKKLDELRLEWGRPIRLVSGSRCTYHNQKVGGASSSTHVKGDAIDVYFGDDEEGKNDFVELATRLGFGGIGWGVPGDGRVHLDVRRRLPGSGPATWRYS